MISAAAALIEIKCPFSVDGVSVVQMSPRQIAQRFPSQSCLQVAADGHMALKEGHEYYDQIMGEMKILGVDWCDFVLYTTAGIFVERIAFNPTYWDEKLFPSLKNFYMEHVVPELITGELWFSSFCT